jgi:hypothetical protein
LNQQLISRFARLLDKSLHHLLSFPAGSDPYATARNVYRNIRKYFEGQEWINKDILGEKWNAISVCISPETTYNEPQRVNAECASVGVGHTDQQMATKFGYLLQTHHPTTDIGLFTDLARAGSEANIQMLWHSAQFTANALTRNALLSPASHHLGQQAHAPRSSFRTSTPKVQFTPRAKVPCDWCGGPHPVDECYSRDCTNVKRFPNPIWPGGVPPQYVLKKYSKNLPRNPNANAIRKQRYYEHPGYNAPALPFAGMAST